MCKLLSDIEALLATTIVQGVEGFVIYTNALNQGYEAILMQNDNLG